MMIRTAYVVRVGDKFVGPRHMQRTLVGFEKAELFHYRAVAKRVAFNRQPSEVVVVKITLEDIQTNESNTT